MPKKKSTISLTRGVNMDPAQVSDPATRERLRKEAKLPLVIKKEEAESVSLFMIKTPAGAVQGSKITMTDGKVVYAMESPDVVKDLLNQ